MVCIPYDKGTAAPGNGLMPSLDVGSRKAVDEAYARAIAAGGKDEGAPGLRGPEGPGAFCEFEARLEHLDRIPNSYTLICSDFAYFRDLDGNKVAVYK
jgi:hypothetical protein